MPKSSDALKKQCSNLVNEFRKSSFLEGDEKNEVATMCTQLSEADIYEGLTKYPFKDSTARGICETFKNIFVHLSNQASAENNADPDSLNKIEEDLNQIEALLQSKKSNISTSTSENHLNNGNTKNLFDKKSSKEEDKAISDEHQSSSSHIPSLADELPKKIQVHFLAYMQSRKFLNNSDLINSSTTATTLSIPTQTGDYFSEEDEEYITGLNDLDFNDEDEEYIAGFNNLDFNNEDEDEEEDEEEDKKKIRMTRS